MDFLLLLIMQNACICISFSFGHLALRDHFTSHMAIFLVHLGSSRGHFSSPYHSSVILCFSLHIERQTKLPAHWMTNNTIVCLEPSFELGMWIQKFQCFCVLYKNDYTHYTRYSLIIQYIKTSSWPVWPGQESKLPYISIGSGRDKSLTGALRDLRSKPVS